jgi:alginate O-acetyltransferase complex protein AlgI
VFWGVYQGALLVAFRGAERVRWVGGVLHGSHPLARVVSWAVMFHLTCYGWLIFRASSFTQVGQLTSSLFSAFAPATIDVNGMLVPLLLHAMPLVLVHTAEAYADDTLLVTRLPLGLRYSVYVATSYLTVLFGSFAGAEFIYFQF